jgi:hypothetical protein
MNYFDQNAIVVGLAAKPEDWKAFTHGAGLLI